MCIYFHGKHGKHIQRSRKCQTFRHHLNLGTLLKLRHKVVQVFPKTNLFFAQNVHVSLMKTYVVDSVTHMKYGGKTNGIF
jgi:hypothetical protein